MTHGLRIAKYDPQVMDATMAAGSSAVHDDHLRSLVDALEGTQRFVIERIFFGGATLAQAARELGFSEPATARIRDEAFARLREWVDGDVTPPAPTVVTAVPAWAAERCQFLSPWGRCQQPAHDDSEWCALHLEVTSKGSVPDEAWHRSVVLGERVPVQAKFDKKFDRVLMYGKEKGDGRPSDVYTMPEPVNWKPAA